MQKHTPTQRLFRLLIDYKIFIIISLIAAAFFVAGRTGISIFIGEFINNIFISQDYKNLNWNTVLVLFGFGFLWSGAQYIMYLFSGKMAIRISYSLRGMLYKKILALPVSHYQNNSSSHILSTASNDITLIETFLMTVMVQLIAQPLTVITIISTMFILNWKLSLYFLILGPIIAGLLGILGNKVQQLGQQMQQNVAGITKIFSESIRHIAVIKSYNSEKIENERFIETNNMQLKLADQELKIRLFALPMSDFLGITAIILILSLGALGIQAGVADASDVTKFVAMAIILSEPISSFNQLILVVRKIGPSAKRIFDIIDAEEEQSSDKPDIPDFSGNIIFKNISFGYKNQDILKDISIDIKSDETLAIVGASGSGKSTLMSLLTKFHTPQKGTITFDGHDIATYCAQSIREHIALVTQDTGLFSDTIYNNITLSKPHASIEEVKKAAQMAYADEFIIKHPDQYERYVGDHGNNLSGGERQRIILARAILKEPTLLLLDEPTSALDNASSAFVTKALENVYGKQTTIIIAHRLITIQKADRIAVMDHGKIIEIGTHEELLEKKGLYNTLYNTTFQ